MSRIDADHRCEDRECIYLGQKTGPGCKCHRTREQMLEARISSQTKALEAAETAAATAIKFIELVCHEDPDQLDQATALNDQILAFRTAAIAATKAPAASPDADAPPPGRYSGL